MIHYPRYVISVVSFFFSSFHFSIQIENNPLTIELKRIVFLNYTALYLCEIYFAGTKSYDNFSSAARHVFFCIKVNAFYSCMVHNIQCVLVSTTTKCTPQAEGIMLLFWIERNASAELPLYKLR